MRFLDILQRCKGETIVLNNNDERVLLDIADDFIVLQGGNPQMKLTEFVPVSQIVRVIRADYATGGSSVSIDLTNSGGDARRSGAH
jgi:hypothetical protein